MKQAKPTIIQIFQDAQKKGNNERRSIIQLKNLYDLSIKEQKQEEFYEQLYQLLNKVITLKKKEIIVDRIISFLYKFLTFLQEKEDKVIDLEDSIDSIADLQPSNDLPNKLLAYYLNGIHAKEKLVRFRCAQLVAISIHHLRSIDEEIFSELKIQLLKRSQDKESNVRVQVAIALSGLQDESDIDNYNQIINRLIEMLSKDPSNDVRRTVLSNILVNALTLPHILERSKDVDKSIRKLLFEKVMVDLGGFKSLSIEQREFLLKNGFSDREKEVKQACTELVTKIWLPTVGSDLIELLEKLDVIHSDVAEMTLIAFFDTHKSEFMKFNLPAEFWATLSTESAFLARVVIEYAHDNNHNTKMEQMIPNASELAQIIQEYSNVLVEMGENEDDEDNSNDSLEFILLQLLKICYLLDFGDEVGRRKIFSILRNLFCILDANDSIVNLLVKIIKKLSIDELDFVRTMIEIVSDIQESLNENERELTLDQVELEIENEELSENVKKEHNNYLIVIHKSILTLKFVLQLCELDFKKNSVWSGLLSDFIKPASKCGIDVIHDIGLQCLALCCVLDKDMAENNFNLFLHNCNLYDDGDNHALRIYSLQTIFDLIIIYGLTPSFNINIKKVYNFFKACLKDDDSEYLSVSVLGLCKLYLLGLLDDQEILARMIQLYFIPTTQENIKLRQSLQYFLEVYSKLNLKFQLTMSQVFTSTLIRMIDSYKQFSNQYTMVTPIQVGIQLADWTDPKKMMGEKDDETITNDIHLNTSIELFKLAYSKNDGERKIILQVLNKLNIESMKNPKELQILYYLIENYREICGFPDLISRNNFIKFEEKIQQQMQQLDLEFNSNALISNQQNEIDFKNIIQFLNHFKPENEADFNEKSQSSINRSFNKSNRSFGNISNISKQNIDINDNDNEDVENGKEDKDNELRLNDILSPLKLDIKDLNQENNDNSNNNNLESTRILSSMGSDDDGDLNNIDNEDIDKEDEDNNNKSILNKSQLLFLSDNEDINNTSSKSINKKNNNDKSNNKSINKIRSPSLSDEELISFKSKVPKLDLSSSDIE
ncbi:hypothetical protein K502DRAFT_344837 [Neoconidiobolus thromboides FSU 785]|nr:hypothetical protein K502DRAFT_344837 [Neoconidiobolus thromboides FSU 785]